MGGGGAGPRTIVKICGLTRLEDARGAVAAGADWLGFVVLGESPRRIAIQEVAMIAGALPGVQSVAVMVSPTPDQALELATMARVQRVQLHRVDPWAWPERFPLPMTFAVPVAPDGSLGAPLPRSEHLVMLDGTHATRAGGTGERVPLETARVVAATRDVILAGGLDAASVSEALDVVRPFGVEASSRLESAPGIKDLDLVRRFVAAVRAWDERDRDRT